MSAWEIEGEDLNYGAETIDTGSNIFNFQGRESIFTNDNTKAYIIAGFVVVGLYVVFNSKVMKSALKKGGK